MFCSLFFLNIFCFWFMSHHFSSFPQHHFDVGPGLLGGASGRTCGRRGSGPDVFQGCCPETYAGFWTGKWSPAPLVILVIPKLNHPKLRRRRWVKIQASMFGFEMFWAICFGFNSFQSHWYWRERRINGFLAAAAGWHSERKMQISFGRRSLLVLASGPAEVKLMAVTIVNEPPEVGI